MLLDFSNTTDVKKGEIYFTKLVESNSKIELKKIRLEGDPESVSELDSDGKLDIIDF